MHRENEEQLLARAVAGDSLSLERLMFENYERVCEHIRSRLGKQAAHVVEAEDVVQDTFSQVFRDIRTFQSNDFGGFLAWVKKIADHRIVDAVRRAKRKKRGGEHKRVVGTGESTCIKDILELLSGREETPSRIVARGEASVALQLALRSLPDDQQRAFQLRYSEGRSIDETARAMSKTPGAIRGLLERSKQNMREILGRMSLYISKSPSRRG